MTATYTCKTCLKSVSLEARFCPFCGRTAPESSNTLRHSEPSPIQAPPRASAPDDRREAGAAVIVGRGNSLRGQIGSADGLARKQKRFVWAIFGVVGVLVAMLSMVLVRGQERESEPEFPASIAGQVVGFRTVQPTPGRRSSTEASLRSELDWLSRFLDSTRTGGTEGSPSSAADNRVQQTPSSNAATPALRAYAIAQIALQEGNLDLADAWLVEATRHSPDWSKPFNARGELASRRGDYSTAVHHFRRAIGHDPGWLLPRMGLVRAFLNLQRYFDADREARLILERDLGNAYAHFTRAVVFGQLDKPTDAIRSAEEALRLDSHGRSGFDPDELRRSIDFWRQMLAIDHSQTGVEPIVGRVESPDTYTELRSRPGSGASILRIPQNTLLTLNDCEGGLVIVANRNGNWCRTSYDGQTGWVFSGFVKQ